MDQFKLLDLNNDVLNIIGDYVKADNDERDFQKYLKKEVIQNSIKLFEMIKKSDWKKYKLGMRHFIVTIDLVLTLLKLNLKRKKYPFLYIVLKIWKIAKKHMMKF